ncbi:hypothetical protein C4544_05365 [candidate division WS5 bacterium]|uniref:Uncharacterized protein n=1 Tax=candidate division WS5 bacterium TaxID=2093353 RepID=A0A419DAX7_9BACT|nr:MAG: hypothetical protein C4544_05365 [candidate division WS5 bacterium]
MDQIIAAVVGAIIGGFLAAGAGWFLDRKREEARRAEVRSLLSTGISDDLQHSIQLYDRMLEDWERSKVIWFATLIELRESRQTYLNNKDWIVLFDNAELRKKLFRYYLKSTDLINTLEYRQRRKYEIEDKFNDLTRSLQLQNPTFTHNDAVRTAVSYMEHEDKEYTSLKESIPEAVNKLPNFKIEAKELLDQIIQMTNK